jgi:hypothetical protein
VAFVASRRTAASSGRGSPFHSLGLMINLEAIKSQLVKASSWSLPLKLLVSASIGAVAGSSVLSFLFEYSTYTYAVYFGFRPPVEGIPHLRAAVVGGSFALLITGALLAAALIVTFRGASRDPLPPGVTKRIGISAIIVAVAIWALPIGCAALGIDACSHRETKILGITLATPIGFFLGIAATSLASWRPALAWWISAGAVLLYYGWVLFQLFSPNAHASMLRATGFGGGIPVTLQLESGTSEPSRSESGSLMLRTSGHVVLLTEDRRQFHEYPNDRVARISYGVDTLSPKGGNLPR